MSDGPPFLDPIPGIMPFGTLTMLSGAPGAGKTAMIAEWYVRLRDGRSIWGYLTNPPTGFAYIASDRSWSSHQQWFDLAGMPDIPRYSLADDPHFDIKDIEESKALAMFHDALKQCNNGEPPIPGSFVTVDPVTPLFIAGSPNASRPVAKTLLAMSREARSFQITLLLVGHFGKQPADRNARYQRPQDRIAGSGAFSGFSDTQMYLCEPDPPDHPFHLFGWNPRHQRPEDFMCQRNEHGLFVPYDVMKEDSVASEVFDCLEPAGPTSIARIKDRARDDHNHSPMTVKRALVRLIEQGRIVKIKRGLYARVRVH
jgi:hypothetical protein